jgi:hypothetical protein
MNAMNDGGRALSTNPAPDLQPQPKQVQNKQPPLSKPKPQRLVVLELMAICGEYPAANVHRLIQSGSYAHKIVAALLDDKQIKAANRHDIKGYRLEYKAKKMLLADNPERFADYLEGAAVTNRIRTEAQRRLRLHCAAEVITLMHNAGVRIFTDTKPKVSMPDAVVNPSQTALSQSAFEAGPAITAPCFYTTKGHNGEHEKSKDISSSRAIGTLLTPTFVYTVYNTSGKISRWSASVETTFRVKVQDYICRKLLYNQYKGREADAIMIGKSLDALMNYLTTDKKSKTGLELLTETYRHFYFITNDDYGDKVLKLLCNATQMTRLKTILTKKYLPPDIKYPIEHDALTEDGNPVLFCCLLNVPRLVKFKAGALLHNKKGRVIAFDFQMEALREYLGGEFEVKAIGFKLIIEWLDQQDRKGADSM